MTSNRSYPGLSRSLGAPLSLLLLAGLATGCVSKEDLETAQTELAACQEEKQTLQAEIDRWQQRFDRESERWQTIETSVIEAVPNALAEFDAERDRILELVPEQVQYEVSSYLEDYFGTLMVAFRQVQGDSRDIKLQLDATQKALSMIGKDTQQIGTAIDEAVTAEAVKRQAVADGLAILHEQLVGFGRERIDCVDCQGRIKLNKREREAIQGFHAEMISAISALQTQISQ